MPEPSKRLHPGSKRAGVLRTLLERGERGLNRFEAERACSDHVLPSTISELCRDYGLKIPRELETVPGHQGKPTECSRYRLSPEDAIKAREVLGDVAAEDAASAERWRRAVAAEERERQDRARRAAA